MSGPRTLSAAKQISLTSEAALDLNFMKRLPLTVWRPRHWTFLPKSSVEEDARIERLVAGGMVHCGPSATARDDARGTYRDVTITSKGACMLRLLKRGDR